MTDEEKKPDTESTPQVEAQQPKPKPKRKTASRKSPATSQPVPEAPPPQAVKKSSSALAVLALLLVLLLAGAGFFVYQQLQKEIQGLVQKVDQSGASDQQQLSGIEGQFDELSGQFDVLSGQFDAFESATGDQLTLLESQTTKSKRQWLIVEAEYLASVANVRLQLAGDLATSIAALRAADQRLKENGSPALFSIRQQIATEISALQSTAMPDVVGLSSRILALENSVSQLEVSDPHTGVAQAPSIGLDGPQPVPEDWEKALQSAWDNLSKLVVVRRNDQPIAAMMTPEQVDSIQKNLALKLETARLALIHQDTELYKSSLEMVEKWLNDYFDESQAKVAAALQEVQNLKGQSVKAQLPDISGSLTALRELPLLQQTVDLPPAPAVAPAPVVAAPVEQAPAAEAPAEEAPAEEAPAEEAPTEEAPAEEAPAEEAPAEEAPAEEAPAEEAPAEEAPAEEAPAEEAPAEEADTEEEPAAEAASQ